MKDLFYKFNIFKHRNLQKHKGLNIASCAFLLFLFIFVLTLGISSLKIFADPGDVIYTDEYGNEYKESDIAAIYVDTLWGTMPAKWNISSDGESDLYAYLLNTKDSSGELVTDNYTLLITGTDRNIINFDYFTWDYPTFGYLNESGEICYKKDTQNPPNEDSWKDHEGSIIVPWGPSPTYVGRITKAVIDEGCNPCSYKYLFANLTNLSKVIFKTGEGEVKTPTDFDLTFYNDSKLIDIVGLENVDTSNTLSFSNTFYKCSSLQMLDMSNWDLSNCTRCTNMFSSCSKLGKIYVPEIGTTNGALINLPKDFLYMNKISSNYTQLYVDGNDKSNVLAGRDVNALDENSNTATLNMMISSDFIPRYISSEGIEYYESDIVSPTKTKWNISSDGTGDLYATIYNTKNLDGSYKSYNDYTMVFSGSGDIMDFEYSYYGSQSAADGTRYSYYDLNGEIRDNVFTSKVTNWRESKITPWSLYDNRGLIKSVVIDNGCDLKNYNLLCTKLEKLKSFTFEADASETKQPKSMILMFKGCLELESFTFPSFVDTSSTEDISYMFETCKTIKNIDFSNCTFDSSLKNLKGLFSYCDELETINGLDNINTSSVQDFNGVFYSCKALDSLDLSSWDVSSATTFENLFRETNIDNLDFSSWNTSSLENMNEMFYGCSKIKELDLSYFDTSNLTGLYYTFAGCSDLESLDISTWDLSKINTTDCKLISCTNLKKIYLPNKRSDNISISIPTLEYYNKTGDVYTPLNYDGNHTTSLLQEKTSVGVKNMDNVPMNMEINLMVDSSIDEITSLRILNNGLQVENKDYKTGDKIDFKISYNTSLHVYSLPIDEANVPVLKIKVDGPSETLLGDSNTIHASFKEINNNVITFSYTVKDDDIASGDIKFTIEDISNKDQIGTYNNVNLSISNKNVTLNELEINKVQEISTSRKKTKVVIEPANLDEQEQEELKASSNSHRKLMEGYEDNTFKPKNGVTREEVAAILTRSLEGFGENGEYKAFNNFEDVNNRWSENYLGFAKSKNLVNGLEDGLYHPTDVMTRAQLSVLIFNLISNNEIPNLDTNTSLIENKKNNKTSFPDIKGRWFEKYVEEIAKHGIVIGYDDGEFKGDRPVTRVEMAIIMNRLNNRTIAEVPYQYLISVKESFEDVKATNWYFREVALATLDLPDDWFDEE